MSPVRPARLAAPAIALAFAVAVPAQAVAAPGGVPGAPAIASVSDAGGGMLLVRFGAPADPGTSAITAYEASATSGASWVPCAVAAEPAACTITNPQPGGSVTVVLRAVNAAGPGAASTPATVLTTAAPSPSPSAPSGPDPDKPATLPSPRVNVRASFDAASNGLRADWGSERLGVGTLPKLTFSRDIPAKAPVERHLLVQARNDITGATAFVAGSWGWVSDRALVFRPKAYWPGNSTITVTAGLAGVVMGQQKNGTWVVGGPTLNQSWTFRTARRLIAKVDGAKHRMTVTINGKKAKTFGVSLGQRDWESRNGVKVIGGDKLADKTYTSQALNITDPEQQYSLDAKWNTRLTPTGEFIHTASWAYGRIGRWNGSHGCTNMFEQDAKWIYDKTIPGDPIVYVNTGGSMMEPWNGPGGLWNIPWDQWLQRSALQSPTGVPVSSNPFVRTGPVTNASA